MIEFTRILCPTDFSDFSRHALQHAVSIARRYTSTLTLLHVRPVTPAVADTAALSLPPVARSTVEGLDDAVASLKRWADTEAGSGVPLNFEVRDGNAASEILHRASEMPSDLIVMGTHGRSGFERLVLGSVTEKVIHKAPCPVLTVPPPMAHAPVDAVRFARIVCGVDFSETSLTALEYALSLAQATGAALHLVHVVEVSPAPRSQVQGDAETRALGEYVAAAADARAKQLQQLVPDSISSHCHVDTVLAIGSAHREILRVATERDADVIVLGAHGFGVSQFLFGSAAHQIVRQAHCPVLTIR